jgi:hypothetical protein
MTPPRNAFAFAPMFNHPPDEHNPSGHDATGAFQPGANWFGRWCNDQNEASSNILLFNNHASPDRAVFDQILHGLAISPYQLDAIAYFGHGTPNLMVSARIGQGFFDEFVTSLRSNAGMGVNIMLYACSCGAPGGFAAKLADALSDLDATVYSHASVGHAFRNPMVRKFPGGTRVCPDGMVTAWLRAFADQKNDLWIRFPFMSDDEIRAELSGG